MSVPSLDEQSRIADCLTTLDARITAQAARLDALARHKRGLMQQLFPQPEPIGPQTRTAPNARSVEPSA